jgi:hypothetical protein
MLRWIVALLVAANALAWAWREGHLAAWGLGGAASRESERLGQQVRPEAIRVLATGEAQRMERAARNTDVSACLESGPLNDAQAQAVRATMTSLQWPGTWSLEATETPARWIVYMGPYPSVDALAKKKQELQNLRLIFEPINRADLEPGLSLAAASTEAEAKTALAQLAQRGVRTAKVVQEREAMSGQRLRLPEVDEAQREQLEPAKAALAASGAVLEPCARSAGAS